MSSAVELHTPTESYDLMRLQNAIAERQQHVDEARRKISSVEGALSDLGPAVRQQEILAAAGYGPPNARASQDRRELEERLKSARETLAVWLSQIDHIGKEAQALPMGPLDVVAGKLLGKKPDELSLEERGVRLKLPEGTKPASLTLFGGRSIEF